MGMWTYRFRNTGPGLTPCQQTVAWSWLPPASPVCSMPESAGWHRTSILHSCPFCGVPGRTEASAPLSSVPHCLPRLRPQLSSSPRQRERGLLCRELLLWQPSLWVIWQPSKKQLCFLQVKFPNRFIVNPWRESRITLENNTLWKSWSQLYKEKQKPEIFKQFLKTL